jgi:phage I-like protein
MKTSTSISTIALSLNSEGDTAPDWIQLTPAGPKVEGRDGRSWTMANPEAVIDVFEARNSDLPIDFEHATQVKGAKGEAALAIGWINKLEVRNREIWGHVAWNSEGAQAVTSKGYRYISPVFAHAKGGGAILRMVSAGLTNTPNLNLAALNSESSEEETAMDKAILEALGLAEGASNADALIAINKMKTTEETALNRANTPDPAQFVPRADYDLALNKVKSFETEAKAAREAEIKSTIDAAVTDGKIAPSSRDYHTASCRAEGGLELFKSFLDGAPEIAANSQMDGKTIPKGDKAKLSDEEIAACSALGMTHEDFAKAKEE